MNEYTLRTLATRAKGEPSYPNTMFPPSAYYRFLKHLAAELQAQVSVVLGVCGGGCCLHLCEGHRMGQVVGIDIVNDYPDNMLFIRQNYANFNLRLGDSIKSAQSVYDEYGAIDLLFIDTIHTLDQTVKEFEAWKPYLSDKAAVCFDDLNRQEMNGFWEWLQGNKVRLDELHDIAEGGFGVWWK